MKIDVSFAGKIMELNVVYIYIYIYVCIYIYTHMYFYVFIYIYIHIFKNYIVTSDYIIDLRCVDDF